jgi:dCTP deaminase
VSVLPYQTLMELGPSLVDPFESANVQPASIDLRLGYSFRVPNRQLSHIDLADVPNNTSVPGKLSPGGFVLHPGKFVLGCTLERIHVPNDMVMYIDGKSSCGRIGLAAHVTAGYFDPGWDGIGTLELVNHFPVPIILRPGKLICQSRWVMLTEPTENPYQGHYQHAGGAGGSRYEG